ncbi:MULTISPECIES: sulfurtransferase [Flavobacteriaceae]|uniref:Sulfurtransferase n=2 Tax=Flavobacteriaceae TaxID=49546 RepID=A0A4Y8AVR9_9FLAO|nr:MULTISPECIES: rhodanese-like domain-containing protein [Flavobacteriaceae]TEW76633.1 sulfurtransferase [Gramella jeungdoensis]GGK51357.1 sulfurtransferase [Lutibacter litoralis]
MQKTIVSVKWLHKNLNDPDLIILDASQTKTIINTTSKFQGLQIKNARFFDIKNSFSKNDTDLPNMLQDPTDFEQACRKLGINKSSKIVVYDNLGIYTSPRVWWLFKTMGHTNIAILNGGLPAWNQEGFELEPITKSTYKLGDFEAIFHPALVKDIEAIKTNLTTKINLVIDARSEGRFDGTAPDPRPDLKSGHIPNSINLPYTAVLENGKFKQKETLKTIFSNLQIDDNPLIFTCGSGITACILMLASELVSNNTKAVYDGSWTEWASEKETPINTKF